MALATPVDREFKTQRAGFIRDSVVLAHFREGLRALVNPETGQAFTEDEIAAATAPGSTWYVRAQAIDDLGQQEQRNALYLADQIRIERATGGWLISYHGEIWQENLLPASGASGPVTVTGVAGTVVVGSTTLGDPNAYTARDPAGNLYQVFVSATIGAQSFVTCSMIAVSTGTATNLPAGTVLTWETRDPNMGPTATVAEDFRGGTDQETEAEFASRLAQIIRDKPGAGNDAEQRYWARKSTNAVEDAFVYPCVLNDGSFAIAITQKRGSSVGPIARIPSTSTIAAARAYLTPPSSPVQPSRPFGLVVPAASEGTNLVIQLRMQRASNAGWRDSQPFPRVGSPVSGVISVSSQTDFVITSPNDPNLPGLPALSTATAPNVPHFALWNFLRSEWVELDIASVQHTSGTSYRVILNSPPNFTVFPGTYASPATERFSIIRQAVEDYFDELGPHDFFDVTTDPRGARCLRFPDFAEQWPSRAGTDVVTRILAALGNTNADGVLTSISKSVPSYQPSPQLGPKMLTLGALAIYEL
jgi:uncharacterized phage protein gp47/JayE